MRYDIQATWTDGRDGGLDLTTAELDDSDHVHVFTDADLGRDGHERLGYGNAGRYLRTGYRTPCTHVAIPLEQYVRIFGEL